MEFFFSATDKILYAVIPNSIIDTLLGMCISPLRKLGLKPHAILMPASLCRTWPTKLNTMLFGGNSSKYQADRVADFYLWMGEYLV
ncbi:hypothetical protein B738_15771 [Photorhabdus temperata subsp. temperata M1021]|nr:hypothetical protein B738_15771 [Photorhabdus temperata subsp. temperata M1021]